MKNKTTKNVVVLSSEGLPFGNSALANKNRLIAKIFYEGGFDVYVFNKLPNANTNERSAGFKNGIKFTFPGEVNVVKSLVLNKLIAFAKSTIDELIYIKRLTKLNSKVYYILSITWFPLYLYYRLISKIYGIKIIISIMEWHVAVPPKNLFHRINNFLFDKLSFKIADAAIPISETIRDEIIKVSSNIPTFILPAISDFEEINFICNNCDTINDKYILYCGNLGYYEVIEFIIKSYLLANIKNEVLLVLILNGDKEKLIKLQEFIVENSLDKEVIIYSNLSFYDLICKYKNSLALLIPLRENIQDHARFPHKLAEYLATGVPVITNKVGDVTKYLKDDSAFFCNRYSCQEFAQMISFVLNNPEKSKEVGLRGRDVANKVFNYKSYVSDLHQFIKSL